MLFAFALIVAVIAGFCAGALITQRQINNFKSTVDSIETTVMAIYSSIPDNRPRTKKN